MPTVLPHPMIAAVQAAVTALAVLFVLAAGDAITAAAIAALASIGNTALILWNQRQLKRLDEKADARRVVVVDPSSEEGVTVAPEERRRTPRGE